MNTTPSVSEEMIEAGVRTYRCPPNGTPRSHAELCRQIYLAMKASEPYAGQTDVERAALVDCIMRYGGRCRDCADNFGICEGSGLPCEPKDARRAIEHVLTAAGFYAANPQHVEYAAALLVSNRSGVGQDARLDRAAADSGLAIINELVCVLEDDGKQAALNRAEIIRDRLKQCRDRARATTLEEEG